MRLFNVNLYIIIDGRKCGCFWKRSSTPNILVGFMVIQLKLYTSFINVCNSINASSNVDSIVI